MKDYEAEYLDLEENFLTGMKEASMTPFYQSILKPACGSESDGDIRGKKTRFFAVMRSPFQTVRSIMDRVYKFDPPYMHSMMRAWQMHI